MKFFGKYRAEVVDNCDTEKRGRIRVVCPKVLGRNTSNWCLPNLPPNIYTIPKIGTLVWIEFEEGHKDKPIWTGCFYALGQISRTFESSDPKNFFIAGENINIKSTKELNMECKKDVNIKGKKITEKEG